MAMSVGVGARVASSASATLVLYAMRSRVETA